MNTDLRKKAKINFQIDFLKLINNAVFGKQKEEEPIWCQNQIIIIQSLSQKKYWQQK